MEGTGSEVMGLGIVAAPETAGTGWKKRGVE